MADAQRFDVPDSWGLENKVAIVTGGGAAGDGIGNGRAAAILLARAGTRVIVVDRDIALAKRTVEMIEAVGTVTGHVLVVDGGATLSGPERDAGGAGGEPGSLLQVNAVRLLSRDRRRRTRQRGRRRPIPHDPLARRRALCRRARSGRRHLVRVPHPVRGHARPPRSLPLAPGRGRAGLAGDGHRAPRPSGEPRSGEALAVLLRGHRLPRGS